MINLRDRLLWAKENLPPKPSEIRVVFEESLDWGAMVLVPDPHWMAAALHGGIHPPIECWHQLEHDSQGRCLNRHILDETPPVGPMTEEEAIEYLIQKDIPRHVWDAPEGNNRRRFLICRRDQLPATRQWRNAWILNPEIT